MEDGYLPTNKQERASEAFIERFRKNWKERRQDIDGKEMRCPS